MRGWTSSVEARAAARRLLTVAGALAFALWAVFAPLSPVWSWARHCVPAAEAGQPSEHLDPAQVRSEQDLELDDGGPSLAVWHAPCPLPLPLLGGPAHFSFDYSPALIQGRAPAGPRSPPPTA